MAVAASERRDSAKSKNVLPGINDLPGVRDNLYTNLLLLGFNPIRSEVKHKIVFNKWVERDYTSIWLHEVAYRHMFDLPNKKAMEVIVYYLFCKLNEALCLDLYRLEFILNLICFVATLVNQQWLLASLWQKARTAVQED